MKKLTEKEWIERLQDLSNYCYATNNCLACVFSQLCHVWRQKYWPDKIPENWNKNDIRSIARRIVHDEENED